jgi:hypothetical protein
VREAVDERRVGIVHDDRERLGAVRDARRGAALSPRTSPARPPAGRRRRTSSACSAP